MTAKRFFIFFFLALFIFNTAYAKIFRESFDNFDGSFNLTNCQLDDSASIDNYCRYSVDPNLSDYICEDFETDEFLLSPYIQLDNKWYCMYSRHNSGYIKNISGMFNQSVRINTDSGMMLYGERGPVECSTPTNCRLGIASIFDEPYFFINETQISFWCSNADFSLYFAGHNSTEGFSISLFDNPSGNDCGYIGSPPNCCEKIMQNLGYPCSSSTLTQVNFTVWDLKANCSGYNEEDFRDIERIELRGTFGSGLDTDIGKSYFDDLVLTNLVSIQGNELPDFNFTINDSGICFNDNTTVLKYPLIINAVDPEDDLIYYATTTVKQQNYTDQVSYGYKLCLTLFGIDLTCNDLAYNYDFLDNTIDFGDNCKFTKTLFFNRSYFNLQEYPNVYNNMAVMAYLNSDCWGSDKSYYYYMDLLKNKLYYETSIYDLEVNESFNFTVYNGKNEPVIALNFKNTGSNISVYNYNKTENLVTAVNIYNELYFSVDYENKSFTLKVGNRTSFNTVANLPSYSDNNEYLKTIGITLLPDTDIYQEYFKYVQTGEDILFTTNEPEYLTVYEPFTAGSYYSLTLYVTDYIHKPDTYNSKSRFVYIKSCSQIEQETDITGISLLEFFNSLFGNNLRQFIDIVGIKDVLKGFLWLFYIGLILFLMYAEYTLTKNIDIVFPVLASSGFIGLISFFLQFWIHFIVSLIGLSLVFALLLARGLLK